MLLATPILSDQASLTASTSPGTLPVANLQTHSIQEVWRALDASAAWVEIDLQTAASINLIALLGHTGTSRSYARVRASDDQATLESAPIYDSGLLPLRSHQSGFDDVWSASVGDEQRGALPTNQFIHFLTTPRNLRFWRIDIVDPNQAYIDFGRLYVANAFQPDTNIEYGEALGRVDPSRINRSAGGRHTPTERPSYRVQDFKLGFASADEMFDQVFEIERLRGTTRDVLFIYDPEQTTHLQKRTIYGTMDGLQPIINPVFQLFEKSFRIKEITA